MVDPAYTKIKLKSTVYYEQLDNIVGVYGGQVVFQSTVTPAKHEEDFPGEEGDIIGVSMAKN